MIDRVNSRFDELLTKDVVGTFKPYLCLVCDELLKPRNMRALSLDCLLKNKDSLTPSDWNFVSQEVADC